MIKFSRFAIVILSTLLFFSFQCGIAFAVDYVINPNDNLKTYVYDNSELNVNVDVPPDGIVSFPLAGELNVLGITPDHLAKILQEKLQYYLKEPKVNVFVTAYNPLKIYLLGAMRSPGAYDYKPGDRLTDYITEAGGFDIDADLRHCYIYPQDKSLPKLEINLKKILEEKNSDLNVELKPFDTIYLKRKSGFLFSEWRDVADALNIILGLTTLYVVMSRT